MNDERDEPEPFGAWLTRMAPQPSARRGLRELVALRATLDRVEALLVAHARADRVSWTEIGRDLGIAKQTAHRRHRDLAPARRRPSPDFLPPRR